MGRTKPLIVGVSKLFPKNKTNREPHEVTYWMLRQEDTESYDDGYGAFTIKGTAKRWFAIGPLKIHVKALEKMRTGRWRRIQIVERTMVVSETTVSIEYLDDLRTREGW